MARGDARAPRHARAIGRVPRHHGQATSLVAALTPAGLAAPLRRPGAYSADRFAADVEHALCPPLRPGQVVVLDNLSIHRDRHRGYPLAQ